MSKPLVSIIIPTFNKAELAVETLKSIANQSYTNWECIVVDDGSDAKAFKILNDFVASNQKFSLYKRPAQATKGANACRNYGLSLAKGKYIQFFDSDDIMLEYCLKRRIETLEKNDLDLVVFSMGIHDEGGYKNDDTPDVIVEDWEEALNAFIGDNRLPWNLQRTLYKASLIKNKIAFNESLSRFQDVEFNIKLLSQLKPKFEIFTEIDCVYRRASKENPRTKDFNKNVFNSIPTFVGSVFREMPPEILKKNNRHLQQWLFSLVGLYADRSIKISQFSEVVNAVSGDLSLSSKQKSILKWLFISKTKLKKVKGTATLNTYLRKKYSEQVYKDN